MGTFFCLELTILEETLNAQRFTTCRTYLCPTCRLTHGRFKSVGISDGYCEVEITIPGIFEYYVEFDAPTVDPFAPPCLAPHPTVNPNPFNHAILNYCPHQPQDAAKRTSACLGYILVEPQLHFKPSSSVISALPSTIPKTDKDHEFHRNGKVLTPLDGICILTIIPKWLPHVPQWLPHFRTASDAGYNMVHLAPVQQRGESNSPYSLFDQHAISEDLFNDATLSIEARQAQLKDMLDKIREQCGILTVTDVVYNHTAHNSEWLMRHPEAGYNLVNSPHLKPAYELDKALIDYSENINKYGISAYIHSEADMDHVVNNFLTNIVPSLRLWEYYVIDVKNAVNDLKQEMSKKVHEDVDPINLSHIPDREQAERLRHEALESKGGRFGKVLDPIKAVKFMKRLFKDRGRDCNEHDVVEEYEKIVNEINLGFYHTWDDDLSAIKNNIGNRARFLRLSVSGPRLGPLSKNQPLCDVNFTVLEKNSLTAKHHPDSLVLANNGWIWNADPLLDFAAPGSSAYLRREVIPWGDCVKLRYGTKKEDNLYLWEHMEKYTRISAELFDGFRIDNCHSTPVHVAQYLLDVARTVRPNLYVMAELFTGSEEKDVLYVSKLGINSLIREAMNAGDPFELSRLAHRFGGQACGSWTLNSEYVPLSIFHTERTDSRPVPMVTGSELYDERVLVVDVKGSSPHALFMDCTHDNETPRQKRTAEDSLANAAIVAMSNCAIGSTYGYDILVPELLNLVHEQRKYIVPDMMDGILRAKTILQRVHLKMAQEGYSEIHVHQENDFTSIHRKSPLLHDGYLLIARSAFRHCGGTGHEPIVLRGQHVKLLEAASIRVFSDQPLPQEHVALRKAPKQGFGEITTHMYHPRPQDSLPIAASQGWILGLPNDMQFSTSHADMVHVDISADDQGFETSTIYVKPEALPPGGIVLFRTWIVGSGVETGLEPDSPEQQREAKARANHDGSPLSELWNLMGWRDRVTAVDFMLRMGSDYLSNHGHVWYANNPSHWPPDLWDAVHDLTLDDLNVLLYRCAPEEWDSVNEGVYNVTHYGDFSYAGLQGFASCLTPIGRNNDLGHSVCGNLRAGPWAPDYIVARLDRYLTAYPRLKPMRDWLQQRLKIVRGLSGDLLPKYFAMVVLVAYNGAGRRAVSLMPPIQKVPLVTARGESNSLGLLLNGAALGFVQMVGRVKSASLSPVSDGPVPDAPAMAAGLTHFSTQYLRCWGRDVMISLRGLSILTGQYDSARAHLIAFGSTVRHGLIPNLLDSGRGPRFNCRDAAWFWLYAIKEYVGHAPEGLDFLKAQVARRFPPPRKYRKDVNGQPLDGHYALPVSKSNMSSGSHEGEDAWTDSYVEAHSDGNYIFYSTIEDLMFEVLERHAMGISFREHNAGHQLDSHMRDEGFNVQVSVHLDGPDATGFVYGGNRWNCGTWMDKMGESQQAGTDGVPATPRDGADVEIVGLCKSVVSWLAQLSKQSKFVHAGVTSANGEPVLWQSWADKIQASFEKYFYVPREPGMFDKYVIDASHVRIKGIYKDTHGSSHGYTDYQCRPNQCIAMVVAPELFDPEHAKLALNIIKYSLVGPLGMKTLDAGDPNYRGYYDTTNDSHDSYTAKGFNYHQGPVRVIVRCKLTNVDRNGFGQWAFLQERTCNFTERIHRRYTLFSASCSNTSHTCWTRLPVLLLACRN